MPKQLYCSRCDKNLGEVNKGRIKSGAVLLCSGCNYNLLVLENRWEGATKSDFPNIFKAFKRAGLNI